MGRKSFFIALLCLVFPLGVFAKGKCELYYVTQKDLSDFKGHGSSVSTLSRSLNQALKASFDFANTLDHYSLGLVSAVTLGSVLGSSTSLEDIKPNKWNQAKMLGVLLYQDSPFAATAVRGVSIHISSSEGKHRMRTGAKGEFSGHFYKWIPYSRIRLFGSVYERKEKLKSSIKVPLDITVKSSVCNASTRMHELPLDNVTFILTRNDTKKK